MTDPAKIERITRSLAYMLRHQPEKFDLDLDPYGYAELDETLRALNERLGEPVSEEELIHAVRSGDRPRYEIVGEKIRALYGHSIQVEPGAPAKPPEFLYVALPSEDVDRARRFGLRGGRRRYLHLALTEDDACDAGRRAAEEYTVLRIRALDAWEEGYDFYDRQALWLAETVPTHLLEVGESYDDGTPPAHGPRHRPRGDERRDERRGEGRGPRRGRFGRDRDELRRERPQRFEPSGRPAYEEPGRELDSPAFAAGRHDEETEDAPPFRGAALDEPAELPRGRFDDELEPAFGEERAAVGVPRERERHEPERPPRSPERPARSMDPEVARGEPRERFGADTGRGERERGGRGGRGRGRRGGRGERGERGPRPGGEERFERPRARGDEPARREEPGRRDDERSAARHERRPEHHDRPDRDRPGRPERHGHHEPSRGEERSGPRGPRDRRDDRERPERHEHGGRPAPRRDEPVRRETPRQDEVRRERPAPAREPQESVPFGAGVVEQARQRAPEPPPRRPEPPRPAPAPERRAPERSAEDASGFGAGL